MLGRGDSFDSGLDARRACAPWGEGYKGCCLSRITERVSERNNVNGTANTPRRTCRNSTFRRPPVNGPRPRITFQIEIDVTTSIDALSPPASKRTEAQSISGSGAYIEGRRSFLRDSDQGSERSDAGALTVESVIGIVKLGVGTDVGGRLHRVWAKLTHERIDRAEHGPRGRSLSHYSASLS